MPVYFSQVAPYCPVSRDQPVGPAAGNAITIRTAIPRAHDLPSAIAAVNILTSIINQVVRNTVRNNVYSPKQPKDKTVNKSRKSRWKEDQSKRVTRNYKYYGVDENGREDRDTWIMVRRIERMVWNDAGWKTSLTWLYGEKGEGEPQGAAGSSTGAAASPVTNAPEPPFSNAPSSGGDTGSSDFGGGNFGGSDFGGVE